MPFFDYDKYTGTSKEKPKENKSGGFFDYDKYTKSEDPKETTKSSGSFNTDKYTLPVEPSVRTDLISNEIRRRPFEFTKGLEKSVQKENALDDAFRRLEHKGVEGAPLVERPSYLERVREETSKAPSFLQPLVFPMAAIAEAPFSRAIGESLGTVKPEAEGYLPVSGAGKVAGQIIAPIGEILSVPGAQFGGGQLVNGVGATLSRFAPGLGASAGGRIAQEAIKFGTEGAITGVGGELVINPEATGKELLQSAAYGAGGGLLFGGGGMALSEGIQKGVGSLRRTLGETVGAIDATMRPDLPQTARRGLNKLELIHDSPKIVRPADEILRTPQEAASTIVEGANRATDKSGMDPKAAYDALWKKYEKLAEEWNTVYDRMSKIFPRKAQKDRLAALDREMKHLRELSKRINEEKIIPDEALKYLDDVPVQPTAGTVAARATTAAPVAPEASGPVRLAELSQLAPDMIPVVEHQSVRPTTKPTPGPTQRGFAETLLESDKPPQGFKERLKSAYTPITNEQTLAQANKRINKDVEEATSFVLGNSRFTAEKATVAQRLIDHYNAKGDFQRAVDVAEKVSEEATRAGQSIQALSMFDKLSPEGVLIFAQRAAKKSNEAGSIFSKDVKVTPDMAANITGLAQATQKMTGVKGLADDFLSILERAKSGEKLSETETQTLRRFIQESKQFVSETSKPPKAPKPPKEPKDTRVRDNVAQFLDAQEKAAKERLRARGIRISSTPLDVWADYAVIGAAKMAKGTIKFAEWSEQMVKELGEEIRPHLQNLYNRSREAFEVSTKKVTRQTISDAERITERVMKAKELPPGDAVTLRRLAQNVSRLSGEEKRIASQDLQLILQTLERPGILRKVSTVQTIGQLLNPKTQVRNSLGNELFYRVERLNKYLATPIDIVRSKITGGERTVTFKTNAQGQFWRNWMIGLKAGWKGVNVNGLETQYDLSGLSFRNKYNPVRYFEKALGASLKSFDTAAYMRAHNKTVGEMATLRAINEGQGRNKALIQKYILEADDNVMKLADEYGRYVTFQDNNLISQGLVKLKRGLNLGKDWGAGDLILKYPKTPGALLHRALEYSPAGFLRSAAILARPIFKKEPNTKEVTEALSRAIIGTLGLSGMGYALADLGIITGAANKDKDIRDLQKSAGQGQYQVNMSALMRFVKSGFKREAAKLRESDFLYTYDWMQPVSIAASIGANVKKNLSEGKGITSDLGSTAYNSIEGGLGTLTEQSVLGGVKRAVEGYPGQTVTDKIVDILSDIPASFVPTFSNQIKQLGDNARRETYSPDKLEASLNRAQAKIPGLAEKLPQQYDTLGREKETYQNNSVFNVMFNPGFSSRYTLSPEARFIVDLINETGDESLAPRVPSKSITIDGQSVKLNGDMFSRFQQLQGEETRKRIAKINPDASLKSRIKRTESALKDAGDKARKTLKKEMGNLR